MAVEFVVLPVVVGIAVVGIVGFLLYSILTSSTQESPSIEQTTTLPVSTPIPQESDLTEEEQVEIVDTGNPESELESIDEDLSQL